MLRGYADLPSHVLSAYSQHLLRHILGIAPRIGYNKDQKPVLQKIPVFRNIGKYKWLKDPSSGRHPRDEGYERSEIFLLERFAMITILIVVSIRRYVSSKVSRNLSRSALGNFANAVNAVAIFPRASIISVNNFISLISPLI